MKHVTDRPSFQGELMIRRIKDLPKSAKKVEPEGKYHIVGHSETGHHHVLESRAADRFIDEMNEFITYLSVAEPASIEHLRNHDTHESHQLAPGFYEIRHQREEDVFGELRRAAD